MSIIVKIILNLLLISFSVKANKPDNSLSYLTLTVDELDHKSEVPFVSHDLFEKRFSEVLNQFSEVRKELNETKNELTIMKNKLESNGNYKELDILGNNLEDFKREMMNSLELLRIEAVSDMHSKMFTDSNGRRKVFIIPRETLHQNRFISNYTWDEANTICSKYNSTLVEIETNEKLEEMQIFLKQVVYKYTNSEMYLFLGFWLNGKRECEKFKWLESNKELSFTNWGINQPSMDVDWDYILMYAYLSRVTSYSNIDWHSRPSSFRYNIICEIDLTPSLISIE